MLLSVTYKVLSRVVLNRLTATVDPLFRKKQASKIGTESKLRIFKGNVLGVLLYGADCLGRSRNPYNTRKMYFKQDVSGEYSGFYGKELQYL